MHSLFRYYENCTLCPRNCGADRLHGETGFCKETAHLRAARAALHMWEEPCISGTNGSGTVFFTGCNLGCIFCQNEPLSTSRVGKALTVEDLVRIYLSLQEKGANNINLVTPSHFTPHIAASLEQAKNAGLKIPVVYNTGSYEKPETLRMLDGLVDVYLPDLKFCSPEIGREYCHAADYFQVAGAAIAEMYRQVGPCIFQREVPLRPVATKEPASDSSVTEQGSAKSLSNSTQASSGYSAEETEESGLMVRGVMVRHLLLPGLEKDAYRILKQLYETYGNHIYLSIMSQYTPMPQMAKHKTLSRSVDYSIYDKLIDDLIDLGVENAFIQEEGVNKDSFIPLFDFEGLS